MAWTTPFINSSGLKIFHCSFGGVQVPRNVAQEPVLYTLLRTLIVIDASAVVLIVLANTSLALTIFTTKSLRSKTYHKGIASMNVLDFLTGITFVPIYMRIYDSTLKNVEPLRICYLYRKANFSAFLFGGLTLNGLTFLSIERYFSICYALNYQDVFNKKKALMVLALLVAPTLVSTVFFAMDLYEISNALATLEILFCIVFFPIIYYKIFAKVKQSAAQAHIASTESRRNQQQGELSKKLLLIVVVVFVCYTPSGIIASYREDSPGVGMYSFIYIAVTIVKFSSLFNPILFLWQDSNLRRGTFAFLRNALSKITCYKLRSRRIQPENSTQASQTERDTRTQTMDRNDAGE